MVANGKADVKMLNKYLSEYSDLIFGKKVEFNKTTSPKEELLDNMKGFRSLFREKVTFKPKVGEKFTKEVTNASLVDLLKKEKIISAG
jgi:hypothetical protein